MAEIKLDFESSVEYDLQNSDNMADIAEKYQIIDKIHHSSISQIFVLRDNNTKELLILKAIRKDKEYNWDLEAIRKIRHPQIVRVIDVRSTGRYIYILKEYIRGITLEKYINRVGILSETNALNIGLDMCEIIGYLQSIKPYPIIYRDLKPANLILAEDGSVKLIDLDSVRQYKEYSPKDTFYIGTEGFAAPEQFGYSQTDVRTDIYTIGTTLYYLLAGKMPEKEKYRLKSLSSIRKDLSKAMCEIIDKCTCFNPENRYQSIDELRKDLVKLQNKSACISTCKNERRLFSQKKIKAVAVVLLIAAVSTAYCLSLNNGNNTNKNLLHKMQDTSAEESGTSGNYTYSINKSITNEIQESIPVEGNADNSASEINNKFSYETHDSNSVEYITEIKNADNTDKMIAREIQDTPPVENKTADNTTDSNYKMLSYEMKETVSQEVNSESANRKQLQKMKLCRNHLKKTVLALTKLLFWKHSGQVIFLKSCRPILLNFLSSRMYPDLIRVYFLFPSRNGIQNKIINR